MFILSPEPRTTEAVIISIDLFSAISLQAPLSEPEGRTLTLSGSGTKIENTRKSESPVSV